MANPLPPGHIVDLPEDEPVHPEPAPVILYHAPLHPEEDPEEQPEPEPEPELCRWFEKTESVLGISECAERNKVKFDVTTLQGRALTWWNSQVATLGLEVANGKPWAEMKTMMKEEFCLAGEIQRMEIEPRPRELLKATREGGENNHGGNRSNNNNNNNNQGNYRDNTRHHQYNNRRQGNARAMTTAQNEGADQTETTPNCNRCGACHFGRCPPTCNNYGKVGHKAKDCRSKAVATGANARSVVNYYECGERGHKSNRCLKRNDQRGRNATGRAYAIRDAEQNLGPNVVTDIEAVRQNTSYEVELANERIVSTDV
ncbi:putative reverse transcriptase domain-containing protein [Tanacetum coccineum]